MKTQFKNAALGLIFIFGVLVGNNVFACYTNEPILISKALGSSAEQCVTFPYLEKYDSATLKRDSSLPYFHAGIDLQANYVPAYAIVTGKVIVACGRDDSSTTCKGRGLIMIETDYQGEKVRVIYLHMSESLVKVGDDIKKIGTEIGVTGSKGTGAAHLHLEVRKKYKGTSAVGRTSCFGNCDTYQKVADITMNPALLVATTTSTYKATQKIVQAGNCSIGGDSEYIGEFNVDIKRKNNEFYFITGSKTITARYSNPNTANVNIKIKATCNGVAESHSAKTSARIYDNVIDIDEYTITWCEDMGCIFKESWLLEPLTKTSHKYGSNKSKFNSTTSNDSQDCQDLDCLFYKTVDE